MRNPTVNKRIIECTLLSVICITLFSCSSFLYPLNPWSDANIFMTIGRGMLSGKKIYTDLFDHKGPALFFIYELAALISSDSFFGVYLIEIVCLFAFLYYSDCILSFYNNADHFIKLALSAFLIVTAKAFSFGGGSVEELVLPVMQFVLWKCMSTMKSGIDFHLMDGFIIGCLMSLLFLEKFTVCGFIAGAAIVITVYQFKKSPKTALQCIGMAFLGFSVFFLICLLYFIVHKNTADFLKGYFAYNFFNYQASESLIRRIYRMLRAYFFYLKNNPALILLSTVGIISGIQVAVREKDSWNAALLISSFASWYFITFIGGVFLAYYILPIAVFSIYSMLLFDKGQYKKPAWFIAAAICFILSCLSPNLPLMKERNPVQKQFIETMHEYKEDPTFLMYQGYDQGFYLQGKTIPSCRFFSAINGETEEMSRERTACVEEKKIDFLISMDSEINLDEYALIETVDQIYDGRMRTYRLYIREELTV